MDKLGHRQLTSSSNGISNSHSIIVVLSYGFVICLQASISHGVEVFPYNRPLQSIVVNDGRVLIGGENVILNFEDETLKPESLVNVVNTSCKTIDCDEVLGSNNVPTVFQIVSFARARFLLFCGSNEESYCSLYNSTTVLQSWPVVENGFNTNLSNGRRTIMVRKRDRRGRLSFVTAVPSDGNAESSKPTFSARVFQYRHFNTDSTSISLMYERKSITYLYAEPDFRFDFIYGFEASADEHNSTYVLRNTQTNDGNTAYISQICNEDIYFRSYMETILECKGHRDLITAVAYNTSTRGQVLLASFRANGLVQNSPLCLYWVDNIDEFFRTSHEQCFNGTAGSSPSWVKNANESCKDYVVSV